MYRTDAEKISKMTIRGSKSLFLPAVLLIVLAITVHGQGTAVYTELDPTFAGFIDLNKKVRADFYVGREKSDEIHAGRDKISAGISFRVRPIFKRFLDNVDTDKQHVLVLGILYEYSIARQPEAKSIEHRLMLDSTFRWELPKYFLLSDRNRLEFRWVNGDYHIRYRNRPMIERPVKIAKRDVTPYLAGEGFWDQRYEKWNIYKFTAGVVVPLHRHFSLDFFYERQRCTTCADKNSNIFGLTFNVFLQLKKK